MVESVGGVSLPIDVLAEPGFRLLADQLDLLLQRHKPKMFVLTPFSNPCGSLYTESELYAIVAVLKKFPDVIVLVDNIYHQLNYNGVALTRFTALAGERLFNQTISIEGTVKSHSLRMAIAYV